MNLFTLADAPASTGETPPPAFSGESKRLSQTGFIATEVEQAAQSLGFNFSGVDKPQNDRGFYGLRYARFVVPLVKAVQEMDSDISAQEEEMEQFSAELEALKTENAELKERLARMENLLAQLVDSEEEGEGQYRQVVLLQGQGARLDQNQPNPFGDETVIKYFIPKQVQQAQLRISDPNGAILKWVPIVNRGEGEILIKTQEFASGIYYYSLILDQVLFDTKKMVFAK
jgi:hypothetical protein